MQARRPSPATFLGLSRRQCGKGERERKREREREREIESEIESEREREKFIDNQIDD